MADRPATEPRRNIPADDLREWIKEMFVRESDAAPILRHLDKALAEAAQGAAPLDECPGSEYGHANARSRMNHVDDGRGGTKMGRYTVRCDDCGTLLYPSEGSAPRAEGLDVSFDPLSDEVGRFVARWVKPEQRADAIEDAFRLLKLAREYPFDRDWAGPPYTRHITGDLCPHGNGLSCRECQYEAEAEDATWD